MVTASAGSVAALVGAYTLTVTDSRGCHNSFVENFSANPCNITPPPVNLGIDITYFTAVSDKCSALLNWGTVDAVNFLRFDVQYSNTGIEYTTVGQVAYDNSNTSGKYSFPYQQAEHKGYYRLKLVDKDGSFAYSKVASVTTNCGNGNNEIISVAPQSYNWWYARNRHYAGRRNPCD